MDINELLATIKSILSTLAVIGVVVQVTPIKINPLDGILKMVGKALNKEVVEKIDGLKAEVEDISDNFNTHEIDQLRWNILDFANSCMRGCEHTKEEFEHVIRDHERYVKVLERSKKENGQVSVAYSYIEDLYCQCMKNNSFLQ